MISFLCILISSLISAFIRPCDQALENLALRHQLSVYKRLHPRPQLRQSDRLFWVWLSKLWDGWRNALIIVKPETVISWHRQGFHLYWAKISQPKRAGRPAVSAEVSSLIKRMAAANPLWGAPRIHGELLKLGIDIAERTVSRLMPRQRKPPSQSWRTAPRQSSHRAGLDRLLHCPDCHFSGSVRVGRISPRPQACAAL